MKTRHITLSAALLLLSTAALAQKVKLKEGSLDALKGTAQFNVKYDYSNMTVTTKNIPEAAFIENKRSEYNKKEAGKGDAWAASWINDREGRFAEQFKEQFDKQSGATVGNFPDAKYTIIFHTTHTETGYNVGISRRPAEIDGEATIVETANPSNVIAKLDVLNCPGRDAMGFDYDTGGRLAESYAVAGKGLGKFLKKKL